MPSEKILQEKQAFVEQLTQRLQGAVAGVVVNYKGITVADDTQLRRKLREAGVEYAVVKNTLLKRAAGNVGLNDLDSVLEAIGEKPVSGSVERIAQLEAVSGVKAPRRLAELKGKAVRFDGVAEKEKMEGVVLDFLR